MKKTAWVLLLSLCACTNKTKAPLVHVSLTDSNRSIRFSGLDLAVINEINRDSVPEVWETLVPVFRMPKDTDLKNYQPVQHGKYVLKDSSIVFTPDIPFVKGQKYFTRCYRFEGNGIWDYIKGKKRLGDTEYSDVVVKP
ncbi:MAG TPA: hypothetical protein VIM55_11760 [Mucilaginibacter sp.]